MCLIIFINCFKIDSRITVNNIYTTYTLIIACYGMFYRKVLNAFIVFILAAHSTVKCLAWNGQIQVKENKIYYRGAFSKGMCDRLKQEMTTVFESQKRFRRAFICENTKHPILENKYLFPICLHISNVNINSKQVRRGKFISRNDFDACLDLANFIQDLPCTVYTVNDGILYDFSTMVFLKGDMRYMKKQSKMNFDLGHNLLFAKHSSGDVSNDVKCIVDKCIMTDSYIKYIKKVINHSGIIDLRHFEVTSEQADSWGLIDGIVT